MRTFLTLLIVLISQSVFGDQKIENMRDATVVVMDNKGSGSGIVYKIGERSYILTCAHVVNHGSTDITVIVGATDRKIKCSIWRMDAAADIAILYPEKKIDSRISFSDNMEVGAEIYFAGCIGDQRGRRSVTAGIISATNIKPEHNQLGTVDQANVTVIPGSSGGGIFDKATGNCLGMVCTVHQETSQIAYYIPTREIVAWTIKNNAPLSLSGD